MKLHPQAEGGAPETGVRVRMATAEDIPAVQSVARITWHDTYRSMLSERAVDQFLARAYGEYSLRRTLNAGGLLVLDAGGRITGYLRLGATGGHGYLGAIYVLPEEQGRGRGRLLWRSAREWFASRGLQDVYLSVAGDNWRARAFYRKLGFVETAETASEIAGEPLLEITCHLRLPG